MIITSQAHGEVLSRNHRYMLGHIARFTFKSVSQLQILAFIFLSAAPISILFCLSVAAAL
jgi:hypothetical protein